MNARCMRCSAHVTPDKGAKLKELHCPCGARYEPMYQVGFEDFGIPYEPAKFRNYNNREFKLNRSTWRYEPIAPTVSP